MFVDIYVVVCDFVHKCESVCFSTEFECVYVCLLFNECCGARSSRVIVRDEPGCSGVDCL